MIYAYRYNTVPPPTNTNIPYPREAELSGAAVIHTHEIIPNELTGTERLVTLLGGATALELKTREGGYVLSTRKLEDEHKIYSNKKQLNAVNVRSTYTERDHSKSLAIQYTLQANCSVLRQNTAAPYAWSVGHIHNTLAYLRLTQSLIIPQKQQPKYPGRQAGRQKHP